MPGPGDTVIPDAHGPIPGRTARGFHAKAQKVREAAVAWLESAAHLDLTTHLRDRQQSSNNNDGDSDSNRLLDSCAAAVEHCLRQDVAGQRKEIEKLEDVIRCALRALGDAQARVVSLSARATPRPPRINPPHTRSPLACIHLQGSWQNVAVQWRRLYSLACSFKSAHPLTRLSDVNLPASNDTKASGAALDMVSGGQIHGES